MARDADATRKRLLEAARKEFSAYGIAGARVDRIAAESGSNKAQIYHYFGSKDGLFDAVFNEIVDHTVSATPIDPTDLPEYAGRLFDGYEQHPEIQRLATWYRLERAGTNAPLDKIIESNEGPARRPATQQVRADRAAQPGHPPGHAVGEHDAGVRRPRRTDVVGRPAQGRHRGRRGTAAELSRHASTRISQRSCIK
jgi:AcrR family transcriptional regulator